MLIQCQSDGFLFLPLVRKMGPVYPRGQEDGLRVIACYYYNYLFIFPLCGPCLIHQIPELPQPSEPSSPPRACTLGASILQGKLSTRCSISYQLRLEVSTWLTHTDETGTRTWQSPSSGSLGQTGVWARARASARRVRAGGTLVHEVNLDMRPCQA